MNVTEHIRARKSDYTLIVQIITIIGAVYVIFAKPAEWDRTKITVDGLCPQVASLDKRVTIMETKVTDQNERIMDELQRINAKLGR